MTILTLAFWKAATERAVKTAAQFVIGGLALGEGVNAFNVDWALGGGFAATGLILSYLTSLASIGTGTHGTPSLVDDLPSDRRVLIDAPEPPA